MRRHVGYVPESLSADGSLTAWENLLVFAVLPHPRAQRRQRIEHALEFMGSDLLGTRARTRVLRRHDPAAGIIQSMLHRPDVLFLMSPPSGWIRCPPRHLAGLAKSDRPLRHRLFITTHDMEEADTLCDHVAIMRHGRVILEELRFSCGPKSVLTQR